MQRTVLFAIKHQIFTSTINMCIISASLEDNTVANATFRSSFLLLAKQAKEKGEREGGRGEGVINRRVREREKGKGEGKEKGKKNVFSRGQYYMSWSK